MLGIEPKAFFLILPQKQVLKIYPFYPLNPWKKGFFELSALVRVRPWQKKVFNHS